MFSIFKKAARQRPDPQPSTAHAPSRRTAARSLDATGPMAPIEPALPGAGVSYDPNLVKRLKDDHQELLAIYQGILNAAHTGQINLIREDLIRFRRIFQGHILMESVRFYVYLDRLLASHESVRDEARAVRKDMNGIAKAVADFIHNWLAIPITPQTLPTFIAHLQEIGSALVARIELEESTLYTLYTETL